MTVHEAECVIEALLFTMGEAVSISDMSSVLDIDNKLVMQAADQLMARYQVEGRGIRVIRLGDSYQMCTDPDMYEYVLQLTHRAKKPVMTGVMLETLAIIAYKQPVTRIEIEKIRGVSCQHAVNKLLEYGLIEETGRLNAPGRPILFGTTVDFLRAFGISSVDELPEVSPEKLEMIKKEVQKETGE